MQFCVHIFLEVGCIFFTIPHYPSTPKLSLLLPKTPLYWYTLVLRRTVAPKSRTGNNFDRAVRVCQLYINGMVIKLNGGRRVTFQGVMMTGVTANWWPTERCSRTVDQANVSKAGKLASVSKLKAQRSKAKR